MKWDPEQYAKFQAERGRPFWDLAALVQDQPARVVDLGCGPGPLTRALHEKLGARETIGMDSSDDMLAKARPLGGGGVRFEKGDIATWDGRGFDLVFSNAALHWVPGHPRLFERLAAALNPGGQLAVQMPANFDQPTHTIAEEVAAELGAPPRQRPVLAPEDYARLLHQLGFVEQHVRLQVYAHLLPSREGVLEWVKGTTLLAYEPLGPVFLERYRERLMAALEDTRPYFFPFKRLLLWARSAR